MKLRDRLLLSFAALVLVGAVGLGLATVVVNQLHRTAESISTDNLAAIETSVRLRTLVGNQYSIISRYLLEHGEDATGGLLEHMQPFLGEAQATLLRLRQWAPSEAERRALDNSQRALVELETLTLLWEGSGSVGERRRGAEQILETLHELRVAASLPYDSHFEQLIERSRSLVGESRQLGILLAMLGFSLCVLGLLAAVLLARRVSRPLENVAVAMGRVGQGDYSVRLSATGTAEVDQVAHGFNAMTSSLQGFHTMRLDEVIAERHRLDTVIDSIDQGLILFDEGGCIERLNPVAAELLDIEPGPSQGKTAEEIFADAVLPAAIAEALHPLREGAGIVGEGQDLVRRVDGRDISLAWSLTPYWHGRRRGLLLMLRDVSRERALEQMRTEFVLRAAHELRTPVTGMRMAVGLLKDRLGPAPGSREAELLDTLNDEMDRTVRLIAQLLDLARLYNQGMSLMPVPIEPAELVDSAAGRFRAAAREAAITMDTRVEPGLPELSADREQIDRVLDNLLSNALRHSPAGGRIEIDVQRLGRELDIAVTDSGEGLDRHQRQRVFEPFVQVGRATGGVGIGLALSREIVEQHGGRLRVEPAPGGGSRFIVTLPLDSTMQSA